MTEITSNKPPCSRADALEVVKRLREAGHVAYFAGGCVRDELLGLTPKDFDVATDAPPAKVQQIFRNTQSVGVAFGVILVRIGKSVVEVATFRSDGKYSDGRRPDEVRFTTAEEDAKRRDFTVNGLFLDPVEGRVLDFVGGQEDLKNRVLRAIGEADHRFEEDHLRLLRAVRFAARFELKIEEMTASAIRAHAGQLKRISPERIAEELRLMLTAVSRDAAWRMLWEFELVGVIFRPASPVKSLDSQRSLFLATSPGETISFGLALAAAAIDVQAAEAKLEDARALFSAGNARKTARSLRTYLKISNQEFDEVEGTIEGVGILLGDAEPRVAVLKRFLARATSGNSREMLNALARIGLFQDRVKWLNGRLDELAKTEFAPAPLITGDDLTAAGMTPGPVFKKILDDVYDAQLEGRLTRKDDAMAMAESILKSQR